MHGQQSNQKALLIGGGGHIGSYVAKNLLDRGFDVVVYDAFVQYVLPMKTDYNGTMQFRFPDDRITMVRGFIENKKLLRHTIEHHKPTHIVNLAAIPMAEISSEYAEECYTSIVEGNTNCLEMISDLNFIERYVFISSSMVYGNFETLPCPEDHPKKPLDLYGGFKYACEVITETYGRRHGIPWTIVRPSSVYGAGDCNMRVFQIFIEKAMRGEEITVMQDSPLDFTYVEDTAEGIAIALTHPNAEHQTYNITRGEGRTLEEGVDILKGFFPDLKVNKKVVQQFNRPTRGALDISKARELGYDPKYSLEEGLEKYVQWYTAV